MHAAITKRLSDHLGDEWTISVNPVLSRDRVPGFLGRLLLPCPPDADVVITTSTPLPLIRHRARTVPVVYDVRWHWETSQPLSARTYRRLDLLRALHAAPVVMTISNYVRAQLNYISRMRNDVVVLPIGPGQFEGYPTTGPDDTKTIVLLGRAAHKRNELAARLISASRLVRRSYRVVAVNVSSETRSLLENARLARDQLSFVEEPTEEALAKIFSKASSYVALGVSEGFGMPYVEAAYFGCDVITPPSAIAGEVLSGRQFSLTQRFPTVLELEEALAAWDRARVQHLQDAAQRRSWTQTACAVAAVVERVALANTRARGQRL